ncbi:MAG: metal-dependent transcriptional regulator [Frondihabitans sp.]|nr:metal-dependent transcriptional regulator [Frondihabitans sp.]
MTGPSTLGGVDIDSITPVAQDYVKAIWAATEWGDPPITTKALASRFGTTAANVTDTMKRLAAQGLVAYEPYRPVVLTATGTRFAVAMVRRHRLLETFLVTALNYGWDEVHDEAERLEHAATERLIDRIDALLGHPATDPHGDPIPDASGRAPAPTGAVRLAGAGAGRHLVRRVSDADPGTLAEAAGLGIVPGAHILVAQDPAGLFLETSAGPRRVNDEIASATWTTPAARP